MKERNSYMRFGKGKVGISFVAVVLLFIACTIGAAAQVRPGALTGVVTDPSGAVIPNAQVTLVASDGKSYTGTSNAQGRFTVPEVPLGEYSLVVVAQGFAVHSETGLNITSATSSTHDVKLAIDALKEEVTVSSEAKALDLEPSRNVGAVVLNDKDLESLSDDPDDLAQDLQALAGPAAGPNGGEIFVDGFSGGKLPPKSSIREIRVNQNPFSAEYDRLGFGRIEILTKPGTDKFRGDVMFNFGDSRLNSRNPFTTDKPDSQRKMYEGTLGGPLGNRSSFFVQLERRDMEEANVTNALVLDESFNVVPFQRTTVTPTENTEATIRLDHQLSTNHTLVGRYEWEDRSQKNAGLDTFSLPTRAFNRESREHQLQITETAVLSPQAIHELRFQYSKDRSTSEALSSDPTIQVPEYFSAGGSGRGLSTDKESRWELADVFSLSRGRHMIKFGGRLRRVSQFDLSEQNFNGSYTFTSIDTYRITMLGLRDGLTPEAIRSMGGGASQFTVTYGQPEADVSQIDGSVFVQDDWRIIPQLTLSAGLRYEIQSNISDARNIAPRIGFAWAPGSGGKKAPIAVIRGGFGVFFERVRENLTMQTERLDGIRQRQYVVPSPDFYPSIPPEESLSGNIREQAIRRMDPDLRAPYIMQTAISVERQLPKNINVGLTYMNSRGVHNLRSRNINAPLPGTYDPEAGLNGTRPFAGGNIYAYESTGTFRQNQIIVNANARVGRRFSVFGFYSFGKAKSDSDGAGSFPANQYDLSGEYSRAGFDVRHRGMIGGSFTVPFGITLSPFIVASSGSPFNITIGQDVNGDSIINDRPAWATDLSRPSVVQTAYAAFDTDPLPGQTIIPRNMGEGPGQFTVNLRVSRTFGFGKIAGAENATAGQASGPQGSTRPPMVGGGHGPRGGRGPGGHGPGGFGGFGGGARNSRYALTLSASARNLLNNVNLAPPIGNLSSDRFGESVSLGGYRGGGASANRVIDLQLRFSF